MKQILYSSFLILFLFSGCSSRQVAEPATLTSAPFPTEAPSPIPTSLPSTMNEAHDVLINFFTLMNAKNYIGGDALYGGSYETLQDWNPDVDPSNHNMLWERACEQNGLQCLLARTVIFKELQGDSYLFQVEFNNPDGSLFVLGPCCGSNETDMPPVSQFEYTVSRNADHKYVVMNMPPYVP